MVVISTFKKLIIVAGALALLVIGIRATFYQGETERSGESQKIVACDLDHLLVQTIDKELLRSSSYTKKMTACELDEPERSQFIYDRSVTQLEHALKLTSGMTEKADVVAAHACGQRFGVDLSQGDFTYPEVLRALPQGMRELLKYYIQMYEMYQEGSVLGIPASLVQRMDDDCPEWRGSLKPGEQPA